MMSSRASWKISTKVLKMTVTNSRALRVPAVTLRDSKKPLPNRKALGMRITNMTASRVPVVTSRDSKKPVPNTKALGVPAVFSVFQFFYILFSQDTKYLLLYP